MLHSLRRLQWFIGLFLFQVLVLNYVHFYQYATPLLYMYFILKMDSGVGRKEILLWSFALGLCIDIFCNTPGMNAAASTFIAFIRRPLLRLQTIREMSESFEPGIEVMGFFPFFRYALSCVVVHALILNWIDAFSLFRPGRLLLSTLTDTLITLVCIVCVEAIVGRKN